MVSTKMFLAVMVTLSFLGTAFAGNFLEDFNIEYGDWRTKILENGQSLSLSLDRASGSAVVSKNLYLFARAEMKIKLIHGNSAAFTWMRFPLDSSRISKSRGVPYPKDQQMEIKCSLWEASNWATRGELIKIDWSLASFTALYQNFNVQASTWSRSTSCSNKFWLTETLGRVGQTKLNWVRQKFMIYDYCADIRRFPKGLPRECKLA